MAKTTGEPCEGLFGTQFPILKPNSMVMNLVLQHMLLGLFHSNVPPTEWEFWICIMQGGAMRGFDDVSPSISIKLRLLAQIMTDAHNLPAEVMRQQTD